MNYLRYSSDEMFSSTELIRKSKSVFDKLNKNEIEKAVILRDGKPSFMLLDFETYERIMKDYEKLTSKDKNKSKEQYLSLDDIEISNTKKEKIEAQIEPEILEVEEEFDDNEEETQTNDEVTQIEDITNIEQMSSDEINEEELLKALDEINNMNIPGNSEESIREEEEVSDNFEDDLKVALDEIDEEDSKEHEPPLKEFWDK